MRGDQRGQTSLLLIGLAVVLVMAVVVGVDASAAFLQRQRLDSLAEGAALYAADAAAQGEEVYIGGLGDEERLEVYRAAADQAAREYLAQAGAYADHPGLACVVIVVDGAVRVTVRAALHLPLSVPGSPHDTTVGATGAAAVTLEP